MTTRDQMLKAREVLVIVLDAKMSDMPEWRAFLHLDRALLSLDDEVKQTSSLPLTRELSYTNLARRAIKDANHPLKIDQIVDFISQHRVLPSNDLKRIRSMISCNLSRDKTIDNVPWEGKHAWWFNDRPIPSPQGNFDGEST